MWKPRRRGFSELDRRDLDASSWRGRLRQAFTPTPRKRLAAILFAALIAVRMLYKYLFSSPASIVIILALNTGGGVLGWKSSEQWAVERTSVKNKQDYVRRHGYALAIRDMPMQRRYAHEWRESWEKVDIIREVMQAYPKAEWFWWLDVSTYIMEPHISLESHLFDKLEEQVYRNLSNSFNPLDIPDDLPFVDNKHDINLIIPQDCGGFNLGSFFIKRSDWTTRLLDIWWDPVHYEQKHMQWEHKEQDALEALYRNHAWIRSGTAFVGNRKINAFPPGACADVSHDRQFFYGDRDFCVNLAGCQFGRNCYDEINYYKAVSELLNKKRFFFI